MQYVFLSHDVDWRIQGASYDHIVSRKDRFDYEIFKNAKIKNPYYNIPEYVEMEEKYGIRSTFFLEQYMKMEIIWITKMI